MSSILVDNIKNRTGGAPTLPLGGVSSGIVTVTDETESSSTTTGALKVSGGVGIAKSLHVGGNVTVGGTLTYEDVTNQDVIGLATFRSGAQFGAAGVGGTIRANGDTTLVGVVTATGGFSGVLQTAAQTNVTSLGTLTGLVVNGDTEFGASGVGGTITAVGHAEFVGIVTVTKGTDLDGYKVEEGKQDGSTSLNGEFDFELENGHIQRYSAATGGNYFPDFRVSSSQSLSSVMDVGDVISVTLIAASSSHYCTTAIKIDNSTSNLDIDWVGGSAPSAANGSGFDVYAFTIMKTAATPAYHIIGNALGVA